MKSLQWLSPCFFLLILAGTSYAQNGTGDSGGVVGAYSFITSSGGLKGVPFSADVVSETTHVLGDGNRIHRESHGKTFRDSEGRTRNEFESEMGDGNKRVIITISDPVAHLLISLYPETKTGFVRHLTQHSPTNQPTPTNSVARRPSTTTAVAPSPSHRTTNFESLGTKEIEGFIAKGTRFTTTIEAGQIGNEKPIVAVHENWVSADLAETLLTTGDDPRSGQNIRRLTNIRTSEPDPLLFQVPADYTVKDTQ